MADEARLAQICERMKARYPDARYALDWKNPVEGSPARRCAAPRGSSLPREEWLSWPPAIVLHGRETCVAKAPRCERCVLLDLCPKIGALPA